MSFEPTPLFNIADYYLDERLREGRGDRIAVRCAEGNYTYREVQARANRMGNALRRLGLQPEQRVIVALPDGIDYVASLFGILKAGGVVVMVNPQLAEEQLRYFYEYSRAPIAIVNEETLPALEAAAQGTDYLKHTLVSRGEAGQHTALEAIGEPGDELLENAVTHRDDAAIWLFSGGTTGHPKGVVQSHWSFANTTELYAKGSLAMGEEDITLSVPKLYFGYATGSNLFFPFSVGGSCILFPGRCTPEALFEQIRLHRPTMLINVPTMINRMVSHPEAAAQDLSCLRICTSAGEALPEELYHRWCAAFGGDLLDGLGTAEMWHVFVTNHPGKAKPGTLGTVVPGFELQICNEAGKPVGVGEIGTMRVRGQSRAIGYWHDSVRSQAAFQGDWYVSSDLMKRDSEGFITYCGRGDDMLKVSGKWVAPQEVEGCLLKHPQVKECAVVGVEDGTGLVKPKAFVVASEVSPGLGEELKAFTLERLEPYKHPREIAFMDALPRTHLGKVDRGLLKRS